MSEELSLNANMEIKMTLCPFHSLAKISIVSGIGIQWYGYINS